MENAKANSEQNQSARVCVLCMAWHSTAHWKEGKEHKDQNG